MTNAEATAEMAEITYALPPPFRRFLNELLLEFSSSDQPNEEFLDNVKYATEELKRALYTYLATPSSGATSTQGLPREFPLVALPSPDSSSCVLPTEQPEHQRAPYPASPPDTSYTG